MATNDGGPAFRAEVVEATGIPGVHSHKPVQQIGELSLRDYFAAKAIPALVTVAVSEGTPPQAADADAYAFADAMLAARGGAA